MVHLRIATRKSDLALWQAEFVASKLLHHHPHLHIELVPLSTQGDQTLDKSLSKIGGKGLFVKELEIALLSGEADIAVHSMKDVPMCLPTGLTIDAICERDDPTDAFVSNHFSNFDDLKAGAILGTSSLRRQCQMLALNPNLNIVTIRGNVNTRLQKLDDGLYDAIILATSGLERLQYTQRIKQRFNMNQCIPAVSQGAIGIECREEDSRTKSLLKCLNHTATQTCIQSERAMNKQLNGSCQVPIAGYAHIHEQHIKLTGLVGSVDGKTLITSTISDTLSNYKEVGYRVAEDLLSQGAEKILSQFK